jgi:hypothetical protein
LNGNAGAFECLEFGKRQGLCINSNRVRTDRTLELQEVLVELILRVEGPFAPA